MDKNKFALLIGLCALIIGASLGAVMSPVTKEVIVERNITVPVEVIKEVTVTKTVEIPVEVEKIVTKEVAVSVPVDNGNLAVVMDFVKDNIDKDATIEYILFEMAARLEVESYFANDFVSDLKSEGFFDRGEILGDYRKSEVTVRRISDAVIIDRDFEDKDLELEYVVTVRAKKADESAENFKFTIFIPFEETVMQMDDIEIDYLDE